MRYRAVVRAEPAGPPRNEDERRLEQLQVRLSQLSRQVVSLTAERDQLALHLWLDENIPQSEIAERLDRADRRAGGDGISYAQTQKRIWRQTRNGTAVVG